MKISEIITDRYKLRIPPTVYYELLADVVEIEEQESTTKNDLGVDLISRADAIKAMQNKAKKLKNEDTINGLCGAVAILYEMPSVTPQEPKTGHWIVQPSNKEQDERDFIWWKCSECGQVIYSETEKDKKEFHAFCGRCGAKMVEPQESEDKEQTND